MSQSEQKGHNNQILRINAGSANELDELFKAVIGPKDGQIPLSVPMRQRNFPASFFKPPDGASSACHSRESSIDNTHNTSFSPPLSTAASNSPLSPASPQHHMSALQNGVNGVHGLTINHLRAHSSPATFNVNANAIVNAQQTQHLRQLSYDIDHLPLPVGWEIAKTKSGERYFINHTEKTTTWEDPRKKVLAQQLNIQNQRLVMVSANNSNNNNVNSNSNVNINAQNIGALPEGWEQSTSPEGDIYFINHIERTTSWFDPRLPINAQQASKTHSNVTSPPPPFSATNVASVPPSLVVALQNMKTSANNSSDVLRLQQQQQQLRLQRLQLEREQMRQRQEEILRQNIMLKHSSLADESSNNIANRMPPITTTGIDPFLGGTNGQLNNDCHSRQESADSGLGLGPNYSLPHTPEDFLNQIDDAVNSGDDTNNNINRSNNNDLGLDSLHVSGMDLGTENMESDDLVPSLPDDFNADLLSNVDALLDNTNVNIMTWL